MPSNDIPLDFEGDELPLISAILAIQEIATHPAFQEDIKEKLEYLRTLVECDALPPLTDRSTLARFQHRHSTLAEEKRSLAEHLYRQLNDAQQQLKQEHTATSGWFFGAGTTVAAFARAVKFYLQSDGPHRLIVTNNPVIALALQSAIQVRLVGGYPSSQRSHYLQPGHNYNPTQIAYDFFILAEEAARCTTFTLSCTRFSFLIGPLVETIENALSKRALFHGATKSRDILMRERQIDLLLTLDKIMPFSLALGKYLQERGHHLLHSSPLAPVFQVDSSEWQHCVARQPPEIQATLRDTPELQRHSLSLMFALDASVLKPESCQILSAIGKKTSGLNAERSWRLFAESGIRLIVTWRTDKNDEWVNLLKEEIKEVNHFLKIAQAPDRTEPLLAYEFASRGDDDGYTHVVVNVNFCK